jgi:hypothetical protein
VQSVTGRVRWANQAHKVRVTDGHEAEAKREESRKPLNRLQRFVLRVLGLQGEITPTSGQDHRAGQSHEHPVHDEHPNQNEHQGHSGPGHHQTEPDS